MTPETGDVITKALLRYTADDIHRSGCSPDNPRIDYCEKCAGLNAIALLAAEREKPDNVEDLAKRLEKSAIHACELNGDKTYYVWEAGVNKSLFDELHGMLDRARASAAAGTHTARKEAEAEARGYACAIMKVAGDIDCGGPKDGKNCTGECLSEDGVCRDIGCSHDIANAIRALLPNAGNMEDL